MTGPGPLRLLKLHAVGNDFLVLVDLDGTSPIDAPLARLVCDRHTGVGADGLIRVTRAGVAGEAGFAMELLNADGSPAETSGNGLRCLALALLIEGEVAPDEPFVITTVAGPRPATVHPVLPDSSADVIVGMGQPVLGEELTISGRRARLVDLGNPHVVVLVDDPTEVDVEVAGPAEESRHPGGINVNFASVATNGEVSLRTWERGAGFTLACGSGSCASVAALADWGLVGERTYVRNPGGDVLVELPADRSGQIMLTGPAQLIGRIELPEQVELVAVQGVTA